MNKMNFVRVRDRKLSLWQSSVADHVRKELTVNDKPPAMAEILKHPMSIATAEHVEKLNADKNFVPLVPALNTGHAALVYQSHISFLIAEALVNNNLTDLQQLSIEYRKFSDEDWSVIPPTGFATCIITYLEYKKSSGGVMTYNDWTIQGKGNINYGVINWNLPNDAKVGILGDWGTGLPDAIALLRDMMIMHKPDAIIHLGDIYYSGTPTECHQYFKDVFTTVFDEVLGPGNRIPVFSMPGNHDYYSWGAEYYNVVTGLNNYPGGTDAIQEASYFCLRTEDNGWQILAMDTGFQDSMPAQEAPGINIVTMEGPGVHDTEATWLRDKMQNFGGVTILMSHHQLFSTNAAINGSLTRYAAIPYFNPNIFKVFWDYIETKVAGWIWGHEHNFAMYASNISNLANGRLVGNSAYEELTSANPYTVNYPDIPYLIPEPGYDQYKLGTNSDSDNVTYYNHGYGILDLGGRATPQSPVQVTYYQFPAWGDLPPVNPVSSALYSEAFVLPGTPYDAGVPLTSGIAYLMSNQDGMAMQPYYNGYTGNYPWVKPCIFGNSVAMQLNKMVNGNYVGGVPLQHGDTITIDSMDSSINEAPHMSAPQTTPWLYFGNPQNSNEFWQIFKRDLSNGTGIHTEDAVYLQSVAFPGQIIVPVYSHVNQGVYLTTQAGGNFYWKFSGRE